MILNKKETSLLGGACMLIGFILITLLKAYEVTNSQAVVQKNSIPNLIQLEEDNQRLSIENTKLQLELTKYNQKENTSALTTQQIQEAKMNSGLSEVTGPGLKITLDDSKKITKETDMNNIIHEQYILSIVNQLWSCGAEAIAVNDQRVMINTEFFCSGSYIQINGSRQMPPYVINAIGDTDKLSSGLNSYYVWLKLGDFEKQYGITRKLETLDKIIIPAGKPYDYHYAEPVEAGT